MAIVRAAMRVVFVFFALMSSSFAVTPLEQQVDRAGGRFIRSSQSSVIGDPQVLEDGVSFFEAAEEKEKDQEPNGPNVAHLGAALAAGIFIGGGVAWVAKGSGGASSSNAGKDTSNAISPLIHPPKDYAAQSIFQIENLISAGREQMNAPEGPIPPVCVLDPEGELTRDLQKRGAASKSEHWPCFHSELWVASVGSQQVGFVPCIVGSPYAVMIVDELFACGCQLVIHITSGGEVSPHPLGPAAGQSFYVLVERALRDEGTSLHWQAPQMWATAPAEVMARFPAKAFAGLKKQVHRGSSWTTDAPFRQTPDATERAKSLGILCVEMESAALISFANARGRPIISFCQVQNSNATEEGDSEKGEAGSSNDRMELIKAASNAWFSYQT